MDGIIIPDLPFEEKKEVDEPALAHNVTLISMIAPTSEERIQRIASEAKGFLYVVSSLGVTGVRTQITTDLDSIVKNIRKATNIPCAIGFGISTPDQAAKMAAVSDGSIGGQRYCKDHCTAWQGSRPGDQRICKAHEGCRGRSKQ